MNTYGKQIYFRFGVSANCSFVLHGTFISLRSATQKAVCSHPYAHVYLFSIKFTISAIFFNAIHKIIDSNRILPGENFIMTLVGILI